MGLVRLFLALAVFTHHEPLLARELLPGAVSVRLFFIISGFYMALVLDQRYGAHRKALFYSNRLLRLLPSYLVVAALSLLVFLAADAHPFMVRDDVFALGRENPWLLVGAVLSNVLIVGQNLFFLTDLTPESTLVLTPCQDCPSLGFWLLLVPQAWSIAVELGFYLLAPFLVQCRARTLAPILLGSLGLHLCLTAWMADGETIAHHTLAPQLNLFILGILSYRLTPLAQKAPRTLRWAGLPLLLATLGLYQYLADPWRFPLAALLLALTAPFIFETMRNRRWDRLLGDLSYPFYISQFLVITVFKQWFGHLPAPWVLVAVLATSLLLYSLVDRPLARFRAKRLPARLTIQRPKQEQLVPVQVQTGHV